MNGMNQAMIDVRGVKQAIWKREMDRRDSIRIKYASKYDESSNYWKNSIGTNKAIRKLKVLDKKAPGGRRAPKVDSEDSVRTGEVAAPDVVARTELQGS